MKFEESYSLNLNLIINRYDNRYHNVWCWCLDVHESWSDCTSVCTKCMTSRRQLHAQFHVNEYMYMNQEVSKR